MSENKYEVMMREAFDRHAPEGFKIALQYPREHWSKKFALATAAKTLSSVRRQVKPEDLRAFSGHFCGGELDDDMNYTHEPEFIHHGWMIFQPEDW